MKLKSKIIASLETPLTFIHLSNLFGQDDAVEYIDWVFDNVVNMDLSGYDYPVVSDEEVYGLIEDMYVMFCYNELNYKKATEKLHAEL